MRLAEWRCRVFIEFCFELNNLLEQLSAAVAVAHSLFCSLNVGTRVRSMYAAEFASNSRAGTAFSVGSDAAMRHRRRLSAYRLDIAQDTGDNELMSRPGTSNVRVGDSYHCAYVPDVCDRKHVCRVR